MRICNASSVGRAVGPLSVDEDEVVEDAAESDRSGDFIVIVCALLIWVHTKKKG